MSTCTSGKRCAVIRQVRWCTAVQTKTPVCNVGVLWLQSDTKSGNGHMTGWVLAISVPKLTQIVVSCDPQFYWGRLVEYGKMWIFADGRYLSQVFLYFLTHMCIKRYRLHAVRCFRPPSISVKIFFQRRQECKHWRHRSFAATVWCRVSAYHCKH